MHSNFLDLDQAQAAEADVVEAVPAAGMQVNEFTAARLMTKLIAYRAA